MQTCVVGLSQFGKVECVMTLGDHVAGLCAVTPLLL